MVSHFAYFKGAYPATREKRGYRHAQHYRPEPAFNICRLSVGLSASSEAVIEKHAE